MLILNRKPRAVIDSVASTTSERMLSAQEPATMRSRGKRFPIRLQLAYRETGRHQARQHGDGISQSIGSREIVFSTNQDLKESVRVELCMDWPALLEGTTALRLVIRGSVLWSAHGHCGVRIERHQFRTGAGNSLSGTRRLAIALPLESRSGDWAVISSRPRWLRRTTGEMSRLSFFEFSKCSQSTRTF